MRIKRKYFQVKVLSVLLAVSLLAGIAGIPVLAAEDEKPSVLPDGKEVSVLLPCYEYYIGNYRPWNNHYKTALLSDVPDWWTTGEIVRSNREEYTWMCPLVLDKKQWVRAFNESERVTHYFMFCAEGGEDDRIYPTVRLYFYWNGKKWVFPGLNNDYIYGYGDSRYGVYMVMTETVPDTTPEITIEGPADAVAGEELTYTLEVTNMGKTGDVEVTDMLPEGVSWQNSVASAGDVVCNGDTVLWTISGLEANTSAELVLQVTVDGSFSGTIGNQAVARAGYTEYKSNVIRTNVRRIHDFAMELVEAKPEDMEVPDCISYPDDQGIVQIPEVGNTELMYRITVSGDAGMWYKVTDEDAVWLCGDSLEGAVPESGKAVIYVSKKIQMSDVNSHGNIVNEALVTPGTDGGENTLFTVETPVKKMGGAEPDEDEGVYRATVTFEAVNGTVAEAGEDGIYKVILILRDETGESAEDGWAELKADQIPYTEAKEGYGPEGTWDPETPVEGMKITGDTRFVITYLAETEDPENPEPPEEDPEPPKEDPEPESPEPPKEDPEPESPEPPEEDPEPESPEPPKEDPEPESPELPEGDPEPPEEAPEPEFPEPPEEKPGPEPSKPSRDSGASKSPEPPATLEPSESQNTPTDPPTVPVLQVLPGRSAADSDTVPPPVATSETVLTEETPDTEDVDIPDVPEEDLVPDKDIPLASGRGAAWALLNLILTICTILMSLILMMGYFISCKEEEEKEEEETEEDEEEETEYTINRKGIIRLFSIIPAIVSVVVFILTEDMRQPMIFIDRWTLLMLVIALIQLVICFFARKEKEEPEEEEPDGEQ